MKTKILVVTPFSRDANSWWRCMGPLQYLANQSNGTIEIDLCPDFSMQQVSWEIVGMYQLVFLHRPCRPEDLTMLKIAKNLNIPVWADYDDWLFHIPPWNGARSTYHNAGVQNIMATILACADVVSVTTQALYEKLKCVNSNVVIVPNAYRSDLFHYRKEPAPKRQEVFLWRGTNTHDGDLNSVFDAWPRFKHKIHFLGNPDWRILNQMREDQYQIVGMNDNLMYFKEIVRFAPKVFLFPLDPMFFNQCKSNIAYIEALHAGALCVAPDMPEWRKPGVVTYEPGNSESFLDAAHEAMGMDEGIHEERVKDAYNYMKNLYDIKFINKIRIEIVLAMVSEEFKRNDRNPFDELTGIWALSELKGKEKGLQS